MKKKEEISEEELLRRIIEYKKYKEITKKLKEFYLENSKRISKNPEEVELPKQKLEKDYNKALIPEMYSKVINKNKTRLNKKCEKHSKK